MLQLGKWVQRISLTLDQRSGWIFEVIRGAADLEDGADGRLHGGQAHQHLGQDDPVTRLPETRTLTRPRMRTRTSFYIEMEQDTRFMPTLVTYKGD